MKGQAAAAQAPAAKRKWSGEEPAPKKRRLLLSPLLQNVSPVRILMKIGRMKKKRTRNQDPLQPRRHRRQQRDQGPATLGVPSQLHLSSQPVSPHKENSLQSQFRRVRRL